MNIQNKLRIALPSKGRLRTDMESLFEEKKIIFSNLENDREYIAAIEGLDNAIVYFLSAKEITNRLDEGSIHVGLTGDDLVQEKITNYNQKVSKKLKLNCNLLGDIRDAINIFSKKKYQTTKAVCLLTGSINLVG